MSPKPSAALDLDIAVYDREIMRRWLSRIEISLPRAAEWIAQLWLFAAQPRFSPLQRLWYRIVAEGLARRFAPAGTKLAWINVVDVEPPRPTIVGRGPELLN